MLKKLLLGSLLAGTAMFIWGFISWMILSWHNPTSLPDSKPLTEAVKATVKEPGVYMLPSMIKADGSKMPNAEHEAQMKAGPLMLAMIRPGSIDRSMGSYMGVGWVTNFVMALVLGLMLSRVPLGYSCLVKLSGMIGLFAGLMAWLPNMNWWEYPASYAVPHIVDSVIMSLIAGSILAKFVVKPGAKCSV
jgi:hypothetical protein